LGGEGGRRRSCERAKYTGSKKTKKIHTVFLEKAVIVGAETPMTGRRERGGDKLRVKIDVNRKCC